MSSVILEPAVKGTVNIFASAKKYGKDVKRIVVTGSVLSLTEPKEAGHVYNAVSMFNCIAGVF